MISFHIENLSLSSKKIFSVFLVFVAISLTLSSFGQKYTYRLKQQTLSKVLRQIAEENRVKIAFDTQKADKVLVDGHYTAPSVEAILQQILSSTPFEVVLVGNVFVVKPAAAASDVGQPTNPIKPLEQPRYKIWGVVIDKETGERLPYAHIYSEEAKVQTSTNSEGYFSIIVSSLDSLSLNVSYLGFDKMRLAVKPTEKPLALDIRLNRIQTVLKSVVVSQRQNNLVQLPATAGTLTLNPRAAADVPSINPLDFTAPLQMLPGIDGTAESAVGLSIRKSSADQTQVLFDGFTVYHLNHFLGQLSAFNTKAIKDIQVYKGGFDARFGDAASAVLEITGKSGNRYKPSFSVGIDPLAVDASVDMPLGQKWSVMLAARRSYTDVYQSYLYDILFNQIRSNLEKISINNVSSFDDKYTPSYHFYDAHGKLSFYPDSTQSFSLTLYGGKDKMDLLSETSKMYLSENSNIWNGGVGLLWSKQHRNGDFLRTSLGYSSYSLDFNHLNTARSQKNDFEVARRQSWLLNHISDFTAKIEYEHRISSSLSMALGGVGKKVHSDFSFRNYRDAVGNIELDTLKMKDTYGAIYTAYGILNFSTGRLKSFIPSVRLSYYSPNKKAYVEPRVSVAFQLKPDLLLKLAAGRYLQFINRIPVDYMGNYNSYWIVADGNTHPVVASNHLIGGFNLNVSKNLQVDVEAYAKKTTGNTALMVQPVISNGKLKFQQKLHYGQINVTGVDLLAKYLLPRGKVAVAYTLSDATVHSSTIKIDPNYPSSLNQLQELKVFFSQKIWRINFSAAWIYGSGKPWDELLFVANLRPSPDYQRNSQLLSPYHRLDLAATYEQVLGKTRLSISANVFNVYNKINQMSRIYGWSATPIQDVNNGISPLQYFDIDGFGVLPTVYVNITF